MTHLDEIRTLYQEYTETVQSLEQHRKLGKGIFGTKGGPKDDPCHARFSDDLERILKDLAQAKPDSDTLREVLTYIYTVPRDFSSVRTAYWMLLAVHGHTLPLIPLLSPEDARMLETQYAGCYSRWERLPVQTQVFKALGRAGRAS